MVSDNPLSADNQQERLINIGWVVGFVDGEGCFSIGFIRQPHRFHRRGYRSGYQVSHEFAVTQGQKSVHCLKELQQFFGVGQVIVNRRYDNHREHLYRYVVRRREDLKGVIIPFFRNHSMHSSKQRDFEKFAQCVEWIDGGKHLTKRGLISIARVTEGMNRCKPRTDLIRILRDYTSDSIGNDGEDIVRPHERS